MLALDGPIGTYLIAHGVMPHRVWRAAFDVPDLLVAAHRAYLEAGARTLLTNTFGLPAMVARERLDDAAIAECIDSALDVAVRAVEAHSASIHLSFGPPATDDAATAREVMERVLRIAGVRIKQGRAVSAWLETLGESDAAWLPQALRALDGQPYALSFLLTDEPPKAVTKLADGAWACGCNCSAFDPKDTLRMQRALHAWSQVPLPRGVKRLCKPSLAKTGDAVLPHAERLGFDLIGACCGGTATDISTLSGAPVLQ